MGKRGYACIGLDHPKFNSNIGSALRAAYAFNSALIAVSGQRYKKSPLDTPKGYRHIPFLNVDNLRDVIPYDCVPVAVDLIDGAYNLSTYIHPKRAFYIFGAEDATLGHRITSWCRDIIYIPTRTCLNLAATVNIVLYDRQSKEK